MKNNNNDSKKQQESLKDGTSKDYSKDGKSKPYTDVELKVCDIDVCKEEIKDSIVRGTIDLGHKTIEMTGNTRNYTMTYVVPVVRTATNKAIEATTEKATTFYEETLNPFLEKNWKPFYEKNLESPINTSTSHLQPILSTAKEKIVACGIYIHERAYVPIETLLTLKLREGKESLVRKLSSIPEVEEKFSTADEMVSFALFLLISALILLIVLVSVLKCFFITGKTATASTGIGEKAYKNTYQSGNGF